MFSGRRRERHDIGRFARKVGRNGRSAGEDRACRLLDCVSELDSDGIDSDLGSMFVGSNHFLLSRVWLCFAGSGLDGDDSSFGDKAGAPSASLGAIQSLGGTIGGSMVALIGGSIYRAMPVAMIAGGVVALTLSLSLGAVDHTEIRA